MMIAFTVGLVAIFAVAFAVFLPYGAEYIQRKHVDGILNNRLTKSELQRLFADRNYIDIRILCYSLGIDYIGDDVRQLKGFVFGRYGITCDRFEYRLLKPKEWD